MSVLGSLRPKRGSTHNSKRVGRGIGSGKGGTAAMGHKGQKARKGAPIRRGFEGGQTPMARRLPKFGFTNAEFKVRYEVVNVGQLNRFTGDVTPETLKLAGLVNNGPVKILGKGELKKALNVKANKVSEKAKSAIESAGGKIEVI
ncbi:MAG: 50S ribosomal protein L15 [Bdellovibrionales bacterium]|nr:50S ribosomal protein L15 [Bdellovibrionales bacterium]